MLLLALLNLKIVDKLGNAIISIRDTFTLNTYTYLYNHYVAWS